MLDMMREREKFTPTEMTITKYIQENTAEVVTLSLDELAERLFVSKSTIIRFCKKMGFHGHKEMCVQLAKELNTFSSQQEYVNPSFPFEHGDDRRAIAEKLTDLYFKSLGETMQDLSLDKVYKIAKIIHDRKSVTVFCQDEDVLAAHDFMNKLLSIGINARLVHNGNVALQAALAQSADSCALIISYNASGSFLPQSARILNERKIPVMVVSGPFGAAAGKYALELVEVSFYETSPKMGAIGSRIAMLVILDLMFMYLFSMDYDKNIANVKGASETGKAES